MNSIKPQSNKNKYVLHWVLSATIIGLIFTTVSCSDSTTNANEPEPEEEPIPEVVTEEFVNQFEIPEDLKVTCLTGETEPGFPSTPDCPVLKWLDHTYWALSFSDNRGSLAIIAINSGGEIINRWDREGDRYLWKIELDEEGETATFIGQASREIVVPWDDLRIE